MDSSLHEITNKITKEFLTDALGNKSQIVFYKVTPGTKLGDNFMSIMYSIEVNLQQGDLVTSRYLLMKCYPTHPGRQEFLNKSNMFFRELEIYRVWIPELLRFQTEEVGLQIQDVLKLPFAPFVFGKCIDFYSADEKEYKGKVLDSLDNFIIMEDIRKTQHFRMVNRRESLDIDHMRLIIEALAKIHSLSWAYRNHVEKDVCKKFPCLVNKISSGNSEKWNNLMYNNIDDAVKILDTALGAGNELSRALIRYKEIGPSILETLRNRNEDVWEKLLRVKPNEKFGKDAPNPEPWKIICHGDCWSNNMLFKYDEKTGKPMEVTLVDLQVVQETCVVNDLVCIIYTNTDGTLRKNYLEELLELYHDKFNEFCKLLKTETLPGFTLDSFRFRFHRSKIFGFCMVILSIPMMFKEEEQALNLENMEHDKSFSDMLKDECDGIDNNTLYRDRLLEITQELYDQGVI